MEGVEEGRGKWWKAGNADGKDGIEAGCGEDEVYLWLGVEQSREMVTMRRKVCQGGREFTRYANHLRFGAWFEEVNRANVYELSAVTASL